MSPLESAVLELRERRKLDHDPWTLLDFEHQIKKKGGLCFQNSLLLVIYLISTV